MSKTNDGYNVETSNGRVTVSSPTASPLALAQKAIDTAKELGHAVLMVKDDISIEVEEESFAGDVLRLFYTHQSYKKILRGIFQKN